MAERPHVVIVGGGFGGLFAAKELRRAEVDVTLVDRTNHHIFQPLLYQVAMAGLSPAEIAAPIRGVLSKQRNVRVLLGEVDQIDLASRAIELRDGERIAYDYLILATGVQTHYFGHDEWAANAPGLKSLEDAIAMRERVLLAFERAERERDPDRRAALLTFVVIGGGPTGVELAGSIAELAKHVLARDFRSIDVEKTRVILIEAGPKILPSFEGTLSDSALHQLHSLGVEVRTNAKVTRIDEGELALGLVGREETIAAATVLWAAGVRVTKLAQSLDVARDRMGRLQVEEDLSLPSHPEAFAVGDMACSLGKDGKPLAGVCQVAMQGGAHAARMIMATMRGRARSPFRYHDKGTMATIGRSRAIVQLDRLRFGGFFAWVFWLVVHIFFLIGFRNRFIVMINWAWSYFSYGRGARLITHVAPPRARKVASKVAAEEAARPPS